jgi:shikimate kinase
LTNFEYPLRYIYGGGFMDPYCRVLNTVLSVEPFVDNVLKISFGNDEEKRKAINQIIAAERNMLDYHNYSTMHNLDNRDFKFREDKIRERLREQICAELIELKRLNDDDEICLEKGGAAPRGDLKAEKRAYYLVGPPASGKSTIANKIADAVGAYLLDSDYAKRKLPEYNGQLSGASAVHEESESLVFSYKKCNLLKYCVTNGFNMVIPKIGRKMENVCEFCEALKAAGYSVYLISIDLDREKATQRAYHRFIKTGRYVPLSLIFDEYANEPTLVYYKIKQRQNHIFEGFAQISTDVTEGDSPKIIEANISVLFDIFEGREENEAV